MSLKDLAQAAEVSVSTVSKAFSGSREISDSTREIIFKKAREMGVYEKYLKTKPKNLTIGIICPEICSEFYTHIIDKLIKSIEANNAFAIISVSGFSEDKINTAFNNLAYVQKTDGIIAITDTHIKNPDKFPLVRFGSMTDFSSDCIEIDIENGVYSAVSYLKDNGHSKIGFIGEKNTLKKYTTFLNAMKDNNIHFDKRFAYNGEERFEQAGYTGIESFFAVKDKYDISFPTAIICAYDYIAIGAIDAIENKGLSVPEDVSVIGMDNIYAAAKLNIPLTSITTPAADSCDTIVGMLLKKISNNYLSIKPDKKIRSALVRRKSVKNIKNQAKLINNK